MILQSCQAYTGVKKRENDAAAILFVKGIREGQRNYENLHGKGKYGSLQELAKAGLVSSELADGEENGFKYEILLNKDKYSLTAIPKEYGTEKSEGNFTLYLDETGIIRSASKKGIDLPKWEIAGPESIPISK